MSQNGMDLDRPELGEQVFFFAFPPGAVGKHRVFLGPAATGRAVRLVLPPSPPPALLLPWSRAAALEPSFSMNSALKGAQVWEHRNGFPNIHTVISSKNR